MATIILRSWNLKLYWKNQSKYLPVSFLDLLIIHIFSVNYFIIFFQYFYNLFSHIWNCLKIHQLSITKRTKKEATTKCLIKDIKTCPENNKKKDDNMFVNNIKYSLNMKNKDWLSTEKNIIKWEKIKKLHDKKPFDILFWLKM